MDRQKLNSSNLQINSVEFVKAGPGAARRESLEELAQGDVIESVGAIEHDALLGNGLRQIFGRLRFTCSRGAFGGTAEMQVQCAEERSGMGVLIHRMLD